MNGKYLKAHRMAWVAFCGAIPNGLHVCHKCDTPCCVNPDHLFLGTISDNAWDRARKGRTGQQRQWATGKCRKGHDITDPKNVRIAGGRSGRQCMICYRIALRKRVSGPFANRPIVPPSVN